MKKLFTTLALVACMCCGNLFAGEVYFNEDFTNGLGSWISIDNDGNLLQAEAAESVNGYFGTSYSTSSATGWFAGTNNGNGYVISCSYTNPATQVDDWLISPEITVGAGAFLQWYAFPLSSSYADGYEVYITDASLTDPTPADFTTKLFSIASATNKINAIDISAYAGKTVRVAFRNNSTDMFALLIDNVSVWVPEEHDLAIAMVDLPTYMKTNSSQTLNVYFYNNGASEITSFDLTYQADGEEAQTMTVTNPNVAYCSYGLVAHSIPWVPTKTGNRTITFTISNINGVDATDANPDDNTASASVVVWDETVATDIHPLYEAFTASTCYPCYVYGEQYGLNAILDKEVKNNGLVLLKYQMNWPGSGDPYYNTDGGIRRTYYGVSGVPAAYGNGTVYEIANAINNQGVSDLYDAPAFFSIENATYSVEGTTVTVNATIKPISIPTDLTNSKVQVAVFENVTTGNVGSNGETEFHHVVHKMIPNGNGTALTAISEGSEQQITLTADMSSTYTEEMDDLGVAIFVQDNNTKQVFQACYATKGSSTGVEEDNDGNGITSIYPNPTADFAHIEYAVNGNQEVSFSLFDEAGNEVYARNLGTQANGFYTHNIDIKALASGQYFMRLTIGDRTFNDVVKVVR